MKLKSKIMSLSLLPIVILGICMYLLAADKIASGIYNEAYVGMQATTMAVRDIFETGNAGAYHMDEAGQLWKGDSLNISTATNIVDNIKESTDMDVTVFWGDTRILTSIVDEKGARQINTQASDAVVQAVLKEGKDYYNKNVDILGKKYIVYYTPFYQEGTDEAVGMIFLGTPQENVTSIIHDAERQLLMVILIIVILSALVVFFMINRIISALKNSMELLEKIAQGDLNIAVEDKLLQRKDEIGDLGRGIQNLKERLHGIIQSIMEKSEHLDRESDKLKETANNVYHTMKSVDRAAQEMAVSCTSQAEDATQASQNVTSMGEMIDDNGAEVMRLNEISGNIKEISESAMVQFKELNRVMENVKESIYFLSQQTSLTNEAVAKISSATELITAIASQTNLLSLNASIEAARAGEHGRGFSVVATEIQQLSEQSNKAAGEIKAMVGNLNDHSTQTLERMDMVKEIIEKQEENIQTTSQIFESVHSGIDESVAGMGTIMTKVKHLEDVRTDTVGIVQNSAAISEENAASIEEIMASIDTIYESLGKITENTKFLNGLSHEMKESIEVFKM